MAPCLKQLDADCFAARPAWAKQAFAYRLVHLLTPKPLTKRLPKALRLALIAPGVEVPPGVEIPAGVVVSPGADIPPAWTPADPIPPGALPPPALPPDAQDSGPIAPLYTAPLEPGPLKVTGAPPALTRSEIISSTSDGWVRMNENDWDYVHDAVTGKSVYTSGDDYNYAITVHRDPNGHIFYIYRSFFYFDLTDYAGQTIKSARLLIYGYREADSVVCAQEGTQADPLEKEDFDSFEDTLFGSVTWSTVQNTIELNAAGLAYVRAQLGDTAKFCLREYTHDYLDVEPVGVVYYANGCKYADESTTAKKPVLQLN